MPARGTSNDKRQGVLFDAHDADARAPQPGSLNLDLELRAALTEAIAGSGKSRECVAEEIEALLGNDPDYPVSKALLDAWTAPSRTGHRFPLAYLCAFIHVTGAHWLLDRLAKRCGRVVLTGEAALNAEIGALDAEIDQKRRRLVELKRGRR